MSKKYPIVALCGDVDLGEIFFEVEEKLTLQGNIVMSPGVFRWIDGREIIEDPRDGSPKNAQWLLADMQKSKIDMADFLYVVNPGGQMNSVTWSAICYAKMTKKKILSLVPISPKQIEEKTREHIAVAERLAWQQLDDARHQAYQGFAPDAYVCFESKGQLILDPWISEDAHAHGSPWADHKNPDEAVKPFEHYGSKRIARFVEEIIWRNGGLRHEVDG